MLHAALCLEIAAALALSIPGQIITKMASTHLLRPMQQAVMPFGGLGQTPRAALAFSQSMPGLQQLIQQLEEPSGTFPVTKAFLQLTRNLLDAGLGDPTLQVTFCKPHEGCLTASTYAKAESPEGC